MVQAQKGVMPDKMYFNASVEMLDRAHSLRLNTTDAESLLWQMLRNRRIGGLKFRRQHAISNFIADFYCHEASLIIELDGGVHNSNNQRERDTDRTFELEKLGLKVIRFRNDDVINDPEKLRLQLLNYINKL